MLELLEIVKIKYSKLYPLRMQILTDTPNGQDQFKACRTCLEEYIDQVSAKK
jgi:hypothetical protein